MNKYNVTLYLKRDEFNFVYTTISPAFIFTLEADNYKYAAAAALKKAGMTEFSIDDLFCIRDRKPGWQENVNITVRSLNKEDYNELAYFYLWV